MIKDSHLFSSLSSGNASENLTLAQKYKILEGLYQEARRLGHFTEEDIFLGIEDDIRLAAILNANVSEPPREESG